MISYSRGEWHAVATAGATAVFDPDLPIETVRAMWAALSAAPGPGAVIQVLVGSFGSSLGSLPSFAVAFCDPGGDAVRLMVRGTARARITRADGSVEEVGGLGVATWSERTVPGAARVELAGAGDAPGGYPLVDGVAGAGRLSWDLAGEVPAAPVAVIHDTLPSALGQTFVTPLDETFGEEEQEEVEEVEPEAEPAVEPAAVSAAEPAAEPAVADPAPAREPDGGHALTLPVEDVTTGYDQLLWGETRTQLVEGAAVRGDGPDAATSSMITGIPATAQEPASAPGAAAVLGDHDGETVSAEQLLALQQRLAEGANAANGRAQTDPALALFGVPQGVSAAAVLLVSTGERVVLDRAAVIGRRPKAVRATGLIPHLVTVASPNQDVSRSHVELRVEGSDVVATDLNTTNGTRLLRVGAEPVRMHPGEATLLVPGDRLDLGDEIVLSFEGL